MKRFRFSIIFIIILLAFTSFLLINKTQDWGFFGHRKINKMAVFTLPSDLIPFYKTNIDYVTQHAIDPDKRRYISKYEAIRHFINPDEIDVYPFEKLPRQWNEALAKFTDIYIVNNENDTLLLFGESQMTFTENTLVFHSDILPSLIGEERFDISKWDYLRFTRNNIQSQYYENDWIIEPTQIDSLFTADEKLIPLKMDVKSVFAKDRLSEIGVLPWHLKAMQYRLTKAFEEKNINKILKISADFGHYIGDAHVPLHTTKNYNGQLTNQYGIHGFWESRLPEMYADEVYSYLVGKAEYIENPTEYYWSIVLASNELVDSVLLIEQRTRQTFPEDQIYCYENVGNKTIKTFCEDYAAAYHEAMQGMVERRMKKAIKSVGSAWFTAWVDAGQPDMKIIKNKKIELTEVEKKELQKEEKAFKFGKIFGRNHGN